ncbi:MAG TPA: hypothetical protein VMM56_10045 [Planctomycetaceae bacterium]|nr:hypothetical protein [Planctomycetaceae bacterium]
MFWPNFDFEHELARGTSWQPPDRLLEINSALACCFCSIAEGDDVIIVPKLCPQDKLKRERVEAEVVDRSHVSTDDRFRGPEWELIPWGVTPSLEHLAIQRDWVWHQPDCELVRQLNDRETSVDWERQTQTLPEGVELISSFAELQTAISRLDRKKWILKARFGMSARERIVGEDATLTAQQSGWIEKRLKEQGSLILEPWLEAVDEVGIQLQIPPTGEVELLAALPLINSPHGEYQGSRLYLSEPETKIWEPAVRIAMQIARDFQRQGYFGPVGIDAMRYRDGDEIKLRPVQDINARWTMGRIAWEWKRLLSSDQKATWFQGQPAEELLRNPAVSNRLIRTSPKSWPTDTFIPSVLLTE